MSSAVASSLRTASGERVAEIEANLTRVRAAIKVHSPPGSDPLLIAVSSSRPVGDILACYNFGHLDFGEHDAQELYKRATQVSPPSMDSNSMKAYASRVSSCHCRQAKHLHQHQKISSSCRATRWLHGPNPPNIVPSPAAGGRWILCMHPILLQPTNKGQQDEAQSTA